MKKIFSIEGPIGIGKSTLLKGLEKKGFTVFPEPVEEWNPWLRRFYTSKRTSKDSIELQYKIGDSIARRMEKIMACAEKHIIMERSLHSGLHVFTKVNQQLTPDSDWENVQKYYEKLIQKWETDGESCLFHFIGLNCSFAQVLQRAELRRGLDTLTQKYYHRLIYDQNYIFEQAKCGDIIYCHDSDTPDMVCANVNQIIMKYI